MPDPDLLVLDEPTAGMEVGVRRDFWDTMHAAASAGRTIIFATHYLEEADHFAQLIIVTVVERSVAAGSTREIRATVAGRVVLAVVEGPQAVATSLAWEGVVQSVHVAGRRVMAHTSHADGLACILLNEYRVTDLEIIRVLRDVTGMFFIAVLPAILYVIFGAAQDYGVLELSGGNVSMFVMISMAAYGRSPRPPRPGVLPRSNGCRAGAGSLGSRP